MYTVSINTDSAAFSDDPGAEVARILRELADQLEAGRFGGPIQLRDYNGNTVGKASAAPAEDK